MAKKTKTMNQEYQLKEAGVLEGNRTINPVGVYRTDRDGITKYFRDLDSVQYCNRFKWVGLPPNIPAWRIEQMLYFRGSLVFYKLGKSFFLMPYTMSDGINIYGLPNNVTPITYNGAQTGKAIGLHLAVNNYGLYDPKAQAVILYDKINGVTGTSVGCESRIGLLEPILKEIVNRFAYLNINLVNSNGKVLIICKDEATKDVLSNSLNDMYNSTSNYKLVRSYLDVQVINNDVEYKEQQLWEDITSWNNLRLEGLGLTNNGLFNKKERELTIETTRTDQPTNAVYNNAYESRKLFVEQVKMQFANDPDFIEQFKGFDVIDLLREKNNSASGDMENTEEVDNGDE